MKHITKYFAFSLSTLLLYATSGAVAQSSQFEIDVHPIVLLGDGVPANDILGYGVGGRYNLNDGWFVSAAIETYAYDLERPTKILGLNQDPAVKTIDADATLTVISAGVGRVFRTSAAKLSWFWNAGIGAGFPDVSDATGPLDNGNIFLIRTDAGTEFHLQGKLGLTWDFTKKFAFNVVARAEHHFMDVKLTEQNSGTTATVDSQSPLGMHLGLSYRF